MASNFPQHMGGQMMPQQQQQRQQQRPQNGPDPREAIQAMIHSAIQNQPQNPQGWQTQVLTNERMGIVANVLGSIRLASASQPNPPNLHKMVELAIRFERDIFEKSQDKATYKREVEGKLEQLMKTREKMQAGLQQSIQQQAQAQAQAQQAQQAQQQQMMMNQNNMQQQAQMRNMAAGQQPFQHLQHQMQASPLPGQPPQMPMGMPNDGMNGNPAANPQQQFQMQMQQQQSQQGQPNMAARPPAQQVALTPTDQQWATEWAQRAMAAAPEDQKNSLRVGLQGRLSQAQLTNLAQNNIDLAFHWFRQQALQRVRNEKVNKAAQAAQQLGLPQGAHAQPMQPQRSMNPSPLNVQAQGPQLQLQQGGDGFMNMENIAAQQQQGMIAQHTGEVVVPVSAQRNPTPQPGMPNPRTQQQQQQQLLLAQQQQRLQQQQQQNQARLQAQVKAQAGLTGQPGGMGPGPMPPQPSPAMPTLNTPMRTPQQMNQQGPDGQGNPGVGQFGQGMDPRFARQMNPAMNGMNVPGGNPGMVLDPQRQAQMANLSPEKLNELVARWGEPRVQQMLSQNAQGLRPGMPMQGNVPQPGQQMPGQVNNQAALIQQFMAANPGRPIPPAMTAGLTPQQQAMLQQQQIARLQAAQAQNPNQMQQRNAQTPIEQNMMRQMDGHDFPPQIFNHASMPQNIPRDLKKWGQLKNWAQQNQQHLGPSVMDNIRSLQKLHYQNLLRTKQQQQQQLQQQQQQQQQQQAAGMPGGPQMGVPGVPNMTAPVAPMGQVQMPMNNGQAIPPPTQDEINQLKNHPQFLGASDDRIRIFLANRNSQMNPLQLQQRNQLILQMQQNNQAQQRRSVTQQPNPAATPQMNVQQPTQTKQPQPSIEQANPVANGNRQQARPQQAGARPAPPASSPVAPVNSLKRASSDDVVEVPNPNAQSRSATQQSQANNQQAQQPRPGQNQGPPVLTPQQIASLKPEQRERYEALMRVRQQSGFNPADLAKLRSINEEESKRPQDPPIQMDQATKASTAGRLMSLVPSLTNVTKAIPKWYQVMRDETRLRTFFHTKNRIQAQFVDSEWKVLKEVFSITPQEVEQARAVLGAIVKDLSERFPQMMVKQDSNQQAPAPTSQAAPQPGQAATAATTAQGMPLNAANLQQQQQQLSKMHQRSGSHSSRPPAAPTSTQPPFQLGAPSPHGLPSYGGKNTVTQEKLHIPPRKKQKQNVGEQGQTTPASNASPQVAKTASPELKRDQLQFRPQAKPALVCLEADCDRHNVGFDTQEALDAHTKEEHIRPLQDPSKYAQENLAAILGLDPQGNVKPAPTVEASKDSQGTAASGLPPNQQAAGKNKDALPKNGAQGQAPKKEEQPGRQQPELFNGWENATINPNELMQSFQQFESGAGGAIADMNVYRSINTPNDTPESSNHVSEPNSDVTDGVALDISLDIFDDSWQPFGRGLGAFADEDLAPADEDDLKMFDDLPTNFSTWDDLVDPTQLEQPFAFDASLFSMSV